jgi:hypothetical protein
MPLVISSSPPSTWTWIASLDIINVFHLSLPHPRSYDHIPYVICVEVQHVLHILLTWLAINPFDITTWHAFVLFHSWCLSFLPWGGEKAYQEMHACLCRYMVKDWDTLQEEHTIRAQTLVSQRSSDMALDFTPLLSTRLHHTRALAHVREYARIVRALAPLFLLWHVLHIFHPTILWVWCMSFCKIDLSLMTLLMALIFFLRYANTSFVVMFLHHYHTCLLDHDYWLWKNKLEAFDPSWLERWFIS